MNPILLHDQEIQRLTKENYKPLKTNLKKKRSNIMSRAKSKQITLTEKNDDFILVCQHRKHEKADIINAALEKFRRSDQKTIDVLIEEQKNIRIKESEDKSNTYHDDDDTSDSLADVF